MKLSQANPFLKSGHGIENFRKLNGREQTLTILATALATIIGLPLLVVGGIFGGTFTFRMLSEKFANARKIDPEQVPPAHRIAKTQNIASQFIPSQPMNKEPLEKPLRETSNPQKNAKEPKTRKPLETPQEDNTMPIQPQEPAQSPNGENFRFFSESDTAVLFDENATEPEPQATTTVDSTKSDLPTEPTKPQEIANDPDASARIEPLVDEKKLVTPLPTDFHERMNLLIRRLENERSDEAMKDVHALLISTPKALNDLQKKRLNAVKLEGHAAEMHAEVLERMNKDISLTSILEDPEVISVVDSYLGKDLYPAFADKNASTLLAFDKVRMQKVNANPSQSLKALNLTSIDDVIAFAERWGKEITSLNLTEFAISDDDVIKILQRCTHLKCISISSNRLTDDGVTILAENAKELTSLNLIECKEVTHIGVLAIAKNQRNLVELNLSECWQVESAGFIAIAENLTNLKKLNLNRRTGGHLTDEVMIEIAQRLTKLEELSLAQTVDNKITDISLKSIAKHLPLLKSLNLSNCKMSDEGLIALASLTKLEVLDISHSWKLTDTSLVKVAKKLTNLEKLYLSGCTGITDTSAYAIAEHLKKLKVIDLSAENIHNPSQITGLGIDAIAERLQLEELYLNLCQYITTDHIRMIAVHQTKLKKLGLGHMWDLRNNGIREIAMHLKNLEELNIRASDVSERGIRHITRRLHHLRVLNLTFCDQISDNDVRRLVQHLPNLRELYIRECANITDASLKVIAEHANQLRLLEIGDSLKFKTDTINALLTQRPNILLKR